MNDDSHAPSGQDNMTGDGNSSEWTLTSEKLLPEGFHIPRELIRQPSGRPVVEPDSVLGDSRRTYQAYKEGKYIMPNDEAEQERLDKQHYAFTLLMDGKLSWAPLTEPPAHAVDIATGTGVWALEFAKQYPESMLIGTDLSRIQPDPAIPNCFFVKEDVEDDWVFSHSFEYIHARFVNTCFDNPKMVISHAFKNLNPGGWIEYQDTAPQFLFMDGSLDGTALGKWSDLCRQGMAAMGKDALVSAKYKFWFKEAVVNVTEKKIPWPCNGWPADPRFQQVGKHQLQNILDGIRGVAWEMLKAAGMTPSEIESFIEQVKEEAQDKNTRFFMPVYVVYGQKPLVT
ncbi:S-adenosyl-L-methionine-dependent methyltransferase [Pseudomassariella vexata]|uniref:S-adenosyl-L-methionine-dependent methyltransferase n=1 Tax=Pseudomassariella vexata TaxID=1141098 RepID=A0A1Y2EC24_9PEZI|nr:S-adenosyl-L-methionine-dependent methyltransferase [Pseudomassariella vexata]ORY68854.1 S-adenosyl-L-methionine-dependent methyltransferase [Pseudomassariella vexata]